MTVAKDLPVASARHECRRSVSGRHLAIAAGLLLAVGACSDDAGGTAPAESDEAAMRRKHRTQSPTPTGTVTAPTGTVTPPPPPTGTVTAPPPPPPPPTADAGLPPGAGAIGPQAVAATALSAGTLFVATSGAGTTCSAAVPCSLSTATARAAAGDVVFLRGGTYAVTDSVRFANSGLSGKPITFESYPGESAVIDGSALANGLDIMPRLTANWNVIRRIEFRGMPQSGISIRGSHNILDGVIVRNNRLSGIMVHDSSYTTPYGTLASYNTIKNSIAADNSDVGLSGGNYADGGNADGISIASGDGNAVIHCLSSHNSDDGIDAWRSTNTHISYSISTGNGLGSGNGNGIKGGGHPPSNGTIVDHVLSYKNRGTGFDANTSTGQVTFSYVTAWSNGALGLYSYASTTVDHTISLQNGGGAVGGSGAMSNDSWQRAGAVSFISTDPAAAGFLRPTAGGGFEDIGAVH